MQKLLIIIPNLNNSAGTERAAVSLANMLACQYSVIIFSLTKKTREPFFDIHKQVQVVYKDIPNNNTKIINKAKWFYNCYFGLNKVIEEQDINIVIGLTHNVNSVISLLKLKNKGLKAIGCEHIGYETIPDLSRKIVNKAYPRLDALITLSDKACSNIKHLNRNTLIIPNPLSFESKETSTLNQNRIIVVARLTELKGLDRIPLLAKYLIKKHPSWHIDIYGEGELQNHIEDMIKNNSLYNVNLYSPVRDIKSEYLSSSIFLSTSHTEALPMTFLEAMQCGLPIISYKHPGSEALITNDINGIIVENENELIEQTSRLITDIDLRKKLGEGGRRVSFNYTPSKIKNIWLQFLNSID